MSRQRGHITKLLLICLQLLCVAGTSLGQVLDKDQQLNAQSFWDNRDFDWYRQNIPFFECPDADITTTYYYRWDLLTKHLTYGSPNSGYSFTEFIDRPFWSGAYGAISCPAGHQLYEARWLKSPRIANDYSRYWFRTPGAQPRNYSTWLADSVWAVDLVHPNRDLMIDLLPDLITNYEGWSHRQFVPDVGLFWQTGHDDGMEFNINSRQTQDILRGAPSYRPSFNAYMWADAKAIAKIANLVNETELSQQFDAKADALREKMIALMWDERRKFFFPVLKNDEHRDGFEMKALSKTYETGKFAGDTHGRELIGYVPWQFNLFRGESRYEVAWKKLMDRDGFYAGFGPSTVERNDPMFLLQKSCCWWSGQSWPYATTQTLKALANLLQNDGRVLTNANYVELLRIYARSHRKDGKPYLAEALHPDTGSFEGHDAYNHSEHYFHSGYCDLIITGLVGLIPRDDDALELYPLAPPNWDYFALDDVSYRGHQVSVLWDKSGNRYGKGTGFHVLVDGKIVSTSSNLNRLVIPGAVPLTRPNAVAKQGDTTRTNFAANNDGTFFPRWNASFTSESTSLGKIHDGNYWYLRHPPNRWTCEGTANAEDWVEVHFGVARAVDTVKLYVLEDSGRTENSNEVSPIRAPQRIDLDAWIDGKWQALPNGNSQSRIEGHRPYVVKFPTVQTTRLRATLVHATGHVSGLTEFEAWGDAELPLERLPHPPGNLAYNGGASKFPRATASHHDRFGGVPESANDGVTNFLPTPTNRWTSYESPEESDWLEIDFGKQVECRRVELAIYDDRGGVQPPDSYTIQVHNGSGWRDVEGMRKTPERPAGSQWNVATFSPVTTAKIRIVFLHHGQSRSGVTEVMVWNEPMPRD